MYILVGEESICWTVRVRATPAAEMCYLSADHYSQHCTACELPHTTLPQLPTWLTHLLIRASRSFQSPSGDSISLHCLCPCDSPTSPLPPPRHRKIKPWRPDSETKFLHRQLCSLPLIWVGEAHGVTATPSFSFANNVSCSAHNYTDLL